MNWIITVANLALDIATSRFGLWGTAKLMAFKETFDIFWDREKILQGALQEIILFEKLIGLKLVHAVLVRVNLGRYSEFHGLVHNLFPGSGVRDWASNASTAMSFKT
jgi:hypothetical protein